MLFILLCTCLSIETLATTLTVGSTLNKVLGSSQAQNSTDGLPYSLEKIASVLNLTAAQLKSAAATLKFDVNVTTEDVAIYTIGSEGEYTKYSLDSDPPSEIKTDHKVVIIIHGWSTEVTADWIKDMAQAYHQVGVTNTLAVYWDELAASNYILAAKSTKNVGKLIGNWLVNKLLKQDIAKLQNVHVIGHSLGAQIAGSVGRTVYEISGEKIANVTGLDAAAPLFEFPIKVGTSNRLDKSDGSYVDAYHTCSGVFGFAGPLAKQDFYVNRGGPIQPGCEQVNFRSAISCSHGRAHTIYTRAINSTDYIASGCLTNLGSATNLCDSSGIIIGENNNATDKVGTFYVNTDKDANAI